MWVIWAPEPVVPSPKDQAYPVKVPGPPVAEAVNVTFEPGAAAAWFADAITEGAGLMATDVEAVALTIVASETVHGTAKVPVAWRAGLPPGPVWDFPPPKFQAYWSGTGPRCPRP